MAVVREYQVLRDAIHKHLARHLAAEDAVKVLERLNWFLDEVIRRTVAEYLRLSRRRLGWCIAEVSPAFLGVI